MSKAKIIAIKIVVFLLLIAICLTISYFFHGLMYDLIHKPAADIPPADIVEPEKPNNEDNSNVVAKELVSKTIVSEKYGTFEIPVNSMLLSNTTNCTIFTDGTDFNYIFEIELEKAKNLYSSVSDASELVFTYDSYHNLNSDILAGTAFISNNNHYFKPENNFVKYTFTVEFEENEDMKLFYPMYVYKSMQLALTLPGNSSVLQQIDVNFYCKEMLMSYPYDENTNINYYFLAVIISDKGCPLTDYIFEEIISDETTKITYNYKE